MPNGSQSWGARAAQWCIRRNPLYLVSAVAMAVGARLMLVEPDARAGEIGLILLTLGGLQLYEMMVAAVLVGLHARRRSPEDWPTLLLVATAFWTGPLAATLEMCARDPAAGFGFALGAAVIALGELAALNRLLKLGLSVPGRIAPAACVVLLALAPRWLRTASNAPTDELALYTCWWLLGAIVACGTWTVREYARRRGDAARSHLNSRGFVLELSLLAVTAAAAVVQLWGMNYAFFAHARLFYAAPVALGAVAVLVECVATPRGARGGWVLPVLAIPIAAIVASVGAFDPLVGIHRLPAPLRQPLAPVLLATSVVWGFAFLRLRWPGFLHAGAAAAGASLLWIVPGVSDAPPFVPSHLVHVPRATVAIAAYAVCGYLLLVALIRRARVEALLAVVLLVAGLALHVWRRTPADLMVVSLASAWALLVIVHILVRRPHWTLVIGPVALLAALTCAFDWDARLATAARVHAGCMLVILFVAGFVWPASGYRVICLVMLAGVAVAYPARLLAAAERAAPLVTMLVAMALLAGGAAVSWFKQPLLASLGATYDADPPPRSFDEAT